MDIEQVAHDTPEMILTMSVDPATDVMPHDDRTVARALGLDGDLAKQAQSSLAARGGAEDKIAAMQAAGIRILQTPARLGETPVELLNGRPEGNRLAAAGAANRRKRRRGASVWQIILAPRACDV